MRRNLLRSTALVFAVVLAMTGLALGQAQTGNLYGKVVAEDGSALPGVSVTLSGMMAPATFTSDSRGEFRFLNLPPSQTYELKCELTGFGTVDQKALVVNLGRNTELRIVMKVAKAEAQVTVTGESPIIDTRKVGTGATVSRAEMDTIPSARDPWVVVQTVPGVQVDRMNVGGNQSGQQSIFVAKGGQTTQGSWNLDGVTVSDMASGASSPTYWDFDSFQELQAVTGGNDIQVQTAGVTLNMVTKRGTNTVHGGARVFITDQRFQATPTLTPEEQRQSAAGGGSFVGSKIQNIQDYGIEIGGPVLPDKLWLWGSYGRDQINLVTVTNFPDRTVLEDANAKLNFQAIESNGLTLFYLRGDKQKFGRNAATTRPPETTWNQTGPTSLYKLEDNQVFSSNLVADAFASYMDEGFQLVAVATDNGSNAQAFIDSSGVWHNNYLSQYFGRPQHQYLGSMNYFLTTGPIGNEFKVGGSYRTSETRSKGIWPGSGIIASAAGQLCSVQCAAITRQSNNKSNDQYTNVFFQDTITMDRLTATLGIRWDHQNGGVMQSSVPGSTIIPLVEPGMAAGARPDQVTWNDWTPRVGLTYALGDARKTLARVSYAQYANQLGAYPGSSLSAIPGVAYAYYAWNDLNHNNIVDPGEYDPTASPTAIKPTVNLVPGVTVPVSPNHIDPNLSAQKTNEIVGGIDHEIFPNFAVGASYTYRWANNYYFSYRSVDGTIPNYQLNHTLTGTLPDGTPYALPVYNIVGAVAPGVWFTNRPNYSQDYQGAELTFTKRMSSGWMARGNVAWNHSKMNVGSGACVDPTNAQYSSGEDFVVGGCDNGGPAVSNAGGGSGAFGNVNLYATWLFNVSGAYQLPLGFTVAGNYFGRQGYPIAWWQRDTTQLTRQVYLKPVDQYRYGWVSELDLRLEKNIPISSTVAAILAADVFNVFNLTTVTQRNSRLAQPSLVSGTNTVFETQSPLVARFSGRITF